MNQLKMKKETKMNDLATKLDQEPEASLTKTRIKLSVIFLMSVAPFVLAYIVFL